VQHILVPWASTNVISLTIIFLLFGFLSQWCLKALHLAITIESENFNTTSKLKIINLKGSRDLSDKKLWNKFLVARTNGITTYVALWEIPTLALNLLRYANVGISQRAML